ncbi:hypothetical protein C8R45DRAFT_1097429 [Mycena sanguinolenta]|nr:hypothetical protein C8R45DRAFT_1097429 [Mycena sanguinolenta]
MPLTSALYSVHPPHLCILTDDHNWHSHRMDKTMTNNTFRRRTIGRATWACYEQIHGLGFDEDEDEDDSLSESEEGSHSHSGEDDGGREGEGADHTEDGEEAGGAGVEDGVAHDMEMDFDARGALSFPSSPVLLSSPPPTPAPADGSPLADDAPPPPPTEAQAQAQANAKGKQRVGEKRERVEGFVWYQGLFVPPYIKDRCASPPPPQLLPPSLPPFPPSCRPYLMVLSFANRRRIDLAPASGFVSASVSSTNSALSSSSMNEYNNYEVRVVEIRVQEGEFAGSYRDSAVIPSLRGQRVNPRWLAGADFDTT